MGSRPDDFFRGGRCISRGIALFFRKPALWRGAFVPLLVSAVVYLPPMFYCMHIRRRMFDFLDSICSEHLHIRIKLIRDFIASCVMYDVVSMVIGLVTFGFFVLTLFSWRLAGNDYNRQVWEIDGSPFTGSGRRTGGLFYFVSFILRLIYLLNTSILMLFLFVLSSWLPVLGQMIALTAVGYRFGVMLLDVIGFGRGMLLFEVQRIARKNIPAVAGIGLAAYFVQMFPFAGLLLLPGAIAGGVLFFREYQFDR